MTNTTDSSSSIPQADPYLNKLPIKSHQTFEMINDASTNEFLGGQAGSQLNTGSSDDALVWKAIKISEDGSQVALEDTADPTHMLGNNAGDAYLDGIAQVLVINYDEAEEFWTVTDGQGFYLTRDDNGLAYFMAFAPSQGGSTSPKQRWKFRKATAGHTDRDQA